MADLGFGFTKLVVSDLALIEQFYTTVFGLEIIHRVGADQHDYALDESILRLPGDPRGHALIIVRYRTRPAPPAGGAWTGFNVDDLDAVLRKVEVGGGRVEVPAHPNHEHGVLAAIASDPEGHLIEIIQKLEIIG